MLCCHTGNSPNRSCRDDCIPVKFQHLDVQICSSPPICSVPGICISAAGCLASSTSASFELSALVLLLQGFWHSFCGESDKRKRNMYVWKTTPTVGMDTGVCVCSFVGVRNSVGIVCIMCACTMCCGWCVFMCTFDTVNAAPHMGAVTAAPHMGTLNAATHGHLRYSYIVKNSIVV